MRRDHVGPERSDWYKRRRRKRSVQRTFIVALVSYVRYSEHRPETTTGGPDRAVAPAIRSRNDNRFVKQVAGTVAAKSQASPGKDGGGSVDRAAQTRRDRQADVREGAVADRVWQEAHRGLRRGGRSDGALACDRGNRLLPHRAVDAGRRRCQAAA